MAAFTEPNKQLDDAIREQSMGRYRLVHRTETDAQMTRAKEFNFFVFLVLLVLGIVPGILYFAWYMAKKDNVLFMTQNPDGSLSYHFS